MPDLDAGKYAAYIWPAYILTVLFFVWITAISLYGARRWKREAERLEAIKRGEA